jgi:hypothetical protein
VVFIEMGPRYPGCGDDRAVDKRSGLAVRFLAYSFRSSTQMTSAAGAFGKTPRQPACTIAAWPSQRSQPS